MTKRFANLDALSEGAPARADFKTLDHALSHDVEGPLRGIKSLAAILLEKHEAKLQDEARDLVKLMGTEAARASRLVEALIDWLRFGQPAESLGWQDTSHLAQEAFEAARGQVLHRKVELRLGDLPHLWSSRTPLRRLLGELLSNALKFSAPRESTLISVSAQDGEMETIITIADNGVGFEPAYSARLFGLFQRLHRQQDFEGTGAGLAIAHQIVRQHRGRIWADSRVDGGATFHFALPKPAAGIVGAGSELLPS